MVRVVAGVLVALLACCDGGRTTTSSQGSYDAGAPRADAGRSCAECRPTCRPVDFGEVAPTGCAYGATWDFDRCAGCVVTCEDGSEPMYCTLGGHLGCDGPASCR